MTPSPRSKTNTATNCRAQGRSHTVLGRWGRVLCTRNQHEPRGCGALTQAETLAAMLAPAAYDPGNFNEAWRNVLLYSEHTWGAWNSVSDSENPFVAQQWKVKQEFAVNADTDSRKLLQDVLHAYASGTDESAVDVHNTSSWPRSEIVLISKDISAGKDHVKNARGVSVPSSNT